MTSNGKAIIPVIIVLVIVAVLVVYFQFAKKLPQPPEEGATTTEETTIEAPEEFIAPPATGNVNEAVEAIVGFSEQEQAILGEGTDETTAAEGDSSAISDFGQLYDENEL